MLPQFILGSQMPGLDPPAVSTVIPLKAVNSLVRRCAGPPSSAPNESRLHNLGIAVRVLSQTDGHVLSKQ